MNIIKKYYLLILALISFLFGCIYSFIVKTQASSTLFLIMIFISISLIVIYLYNNKGSKE